MMTATLCRRLAIAIGLLVVAAPGLAQDASAGDTATDTATRLYGPVSVTRPVMANGATLAVGTDSIRITGDASGPERWVELVADGRVAGRELATVIPSTDIGGIAGMTPVTRGARVDLLSGDDYVRIWVNAGDTHYLIHLPVA